MAKALITRPDGTTVSIEGTPQEIAELIQKVEVKTEAKGVRHLAGKDGPMRPRATLPDLLVSLIDGGFFKKPKDLGSIKGALAEMGHMFPVTTLSPTMVRFVRKKYLRRIKQENRWFYTG